MWDKINAENIISQEENIMGLTEQEQLIMDKLSDCHKEILKLELQHPNELQEFVDGIHQIQSIIGLRVIRRCYPKGWLTYKEIK